jgi:hypothetical protein
MFIVFVFVCDLWLYMNVYVNYNYMWTACTELYVILE